MRTVGRSCIKMSISPTPIWCGCQRPQIPLKAVKTYFLCQLWTWIRIWWQSVGCLGTVSQIWSNHTHTVLMKKIGCFFYGVILLTNTIVVFFFFFIFLTLIATYEYSLRENKCLWIEAKFTGFFKLFPFIIVSQWIQMCWKISKLI